MKTKIGFNDLEHGKYYHFKRTYTTSNGDISMIGQVIKKTDNFISIQPILFTAGYGDKDIREFNKLGFEGFYDVDREVEPDNEYPEYFI